MDSKRKSGGDVGGEDLNDRAAKRRKLPNDHSDLPNGETHENTTKVGLKLLDIIRKTEDKNGRLVATAFFNLPSKRHFPDYYQVTRMPIALDDVEKKLKRGEFPTLTTLESYLRRMVQNAKEYNQKGSEVYEDSERVRKAVSNFMVKNNPAYKVKSYTAFPTPLPDVDSQHADSVEPDDEPESESGSKKKSRPAKGVARRRSSVTPAVSETRYTTIGYDDLNFQQAQEKILEDLLVEKELPTDDFLAFADFVDLPPRALKDYYRTIKNPISLVSLQKRVKGATKKSEVGGVSDFRSWAAFEEEASNLWKNAFFYNEDGSEISARAARLQQSFLKYLNEAKRAVPEPVATKIKLKLAEAPAPSTKLTLKIGTKASPAVTPGPQTNGSSSSNAVANGSTRRNPFAAPLASATPVPAVGQLDRAKSISGSAASPSPSVVAPVKSEEAARDSPAISAPNGQRSTSQASSTPVVSASVMAPPPSTPGLSNLNTYNPAGYAQSFNHQPQHQQPAPILESKWRPAGQDASNAMITNLSLATHPGLNISRHFHMDLPASATMTQQSVTINLPSTHYYLQLKPTIAPSLLQRQHKVFVTCGSRLSALPLNPGHPIDPLHALYEARLHPGVNRIEIEIIAALIKGSKPVNGLDYETEKITIYANLMKPRD